MTNQLHVLLSAFLEPQRIEFMAIAAKRIATNAEKMRQDAIKNNNEYLASTKEAIEKMQVIVKRLKNGIQCESDNTRYVNAKLRLMRLQDNLKAFESENQTAKLEKFVADYETGVTRSCEKHFESAVIKLVARIQKEGLSIEKTTIVRPEVNVDVTGFVTDGQVHIKCTTIHAWGEIYKPHYRFLTKRVKEIK